MTGFWLFVGLFIFNCLSEFKCDICKTCSCSNTDEDHIIDCHNKQMGIDIDRYDFSALMDHNTSRAFVLSKNELKVLPSHLMKTLKNVKILDISNNSISEIPVYDITDAIVLKVLDFSHNELKKFDNILFNVFPSLLKLDFSYNQINTLSESMIEMEQHPLKHLNISHNDIIELPDKFLYYATNLHELDLSFNKISSLNQSLINLTNLKSFSIDNNRLISLNFQELSSSLISLSIGYNMIGNSFMNMISLDKLKYLYVQGNKISNFPNITLKELQVLDISYNNFNVVPETISFQNLPSLDKLIMDGNPIKEIKFFSLLKLKSLSASHLELLQYIGNDSFSNIISADEDCINFTISNNSNLNLIHEDAFTNLSFCSLNLRGNNLTYISSNLLKSENGWRATKGVDLQKNPFNCNCVLQWMLNDLVPFLYETNQFLLIELRCASPNLLSNTRMIHWYKWTTQVFCNNDSDTSSLPNTAQIVEKQEVITLTFGQGMLWVLCISCGVLSILVMTGIFFSNRIIKQKRLRNRLY